MTTPQTEAGRALAHYLFDPGGTREGLPTRSDILAIESEARESLRERLRITTECLDEALSALRTTQPQMFQDDWRRALSDARAAIANTEPVSPDPLWRDFEAGS
jgi:hypothetical protein